ncbi:MAG: phosphotransferase [Acidimicrobiales bacterium]
MSTVGPAERVIWSLAQRCRADDVVVVGVGTPVAAAAALVAREVLHPDMTVLFGTIVRPDTHDLATSLADGGVAARLADGVLGQSEILDLIQRGGVTLQFVSPAQVDRSGDINASRIVRPDAADIVLPGPLALADTASLVGRLVGYRIGHSTRFLVEAVDYVTAAGRTRRDRAPVATSGEGLVALVTELAELEWREDGTVVVAGLRAGVDPDEVVAATGFAVVDASTAPVLDDPPDEVLEVLDRLVDPHGMRNLEVRAGRAAALDHLLAAEPRPAAPAAKTPGDGGLTPEVLTPVFRANLGDDATVEGARRGPVGNGQETWFVTLTDGREFVLRRTAVGGTLEWTDRAAEFAVLKALAATDLPVPTVHWFDGAGGELERAYFVMDRLDGRPLGLGDPDTNAAVADDFGRLLARLHATAPGHVDGGPPRPADTAEATRAELAAAIERYTTEPPGPNVVITALLGWLETNVPVVADEPVLQWGDPGPHNFLVADGRITALLDWELTRWGHRLDDLGGAVWSCLGILDPERVVAAYEAESGVPVDRDLLAWYEVLAHVSRSTMNLGGVRAFVEGRSPNPNVAGLGQALTTASTCRAVRAAWGLDVSAVEVESGAVTPPEITGLEPRPLPAETMRGVAEFLRAEVAGHLEDRRSDRMVRIAGPLLESAAERLGEDYDVGLVGLLDSAGVPAGPLDDRVRTVEVDGSFAEHRAAVRAAIVQVLARQRAALRGLEALYGPTVAI